MKFIVRCLIVCCVSLISLPDGKAAAGQPNIVLVFIDDMGWSDFSCFGNDNAQTPNCL